ncbi:hypothetical protein [Kitasatospora viridis]|uniref:Uncharacterized protein n=1 Tax=Kitasatospora viridis TaxID=281105 RepID=A0A561UN93_9ACTN|nr:hypothetical protein [Kitasatospora viridis]TWG00836.1 hypothetical protein FHX73_114716 [Kitasatospora viridis]
MSTTPEPPAVQAKPPDGPPPTAPKTGGASDSDRQRTLASLLLVIAYGLLLVFLVYYAMDRSTKLASLSSYLPALISALLGLVTNPEKQASTRLWALMVLATGVTAVLAGLQVFLHPANVGALPALIAAVAALGTLFVDSSSQTHGVTSKP